MSTRFKLFATVAFPLLSASVTIQPALADSLMKPYEVAQEGGISQDGGEQVPEELLRKKRKQRAEQSEEQPAAQTEQQQQKEVQPSGEDDAAKAAEEKIKARAERKKRQQAEQQQQEEAQPPADDEAAKAAEERAKIRAERKKRQQAEQQQEEVQPSADDEAAKTAEERAKIRAERRKRQEAEGQQQEDAQQPAPEGELRPAIDGEGEATETRRKRPDRREPIPEVVDTRSEEEKQEIARDPAATDDTVVLPVDKGAAVLDSDKDADNADGNARETRRKQRERARAEEENVEVPKSDEEAQSSRRDRSPTREELEANIKEEGRRAERVPEFNANDLIEAFTGSDGSRPRIDETRDNRVVLDFGDQIIVRGDDRPRLRRNAQETYYEELSRGRSREVIERPNGIRIVTIYNRYGDIVQRMRIDRDGREYLMIYAPEVDEGPRASIYDAGEDLPPMRLRVPVRDYIIDTSSEPDRDYYDFLAEPPVEQVERVYSIDEVRNSARIRDKVRRIDLDTITFATGSAEVPTSQAKTLRKVADAMLQVIEKDPGETFFIEGHTDAVGGDESNLVLSDERAESVASLLTEVYEIPAENLVTQGYGERFLKVRTQEAEQENRRVTIRRVTPLVRPVVQN